MPRLESRHLALARQERAQITTIEAGAFDGLTNLQELFLYGNKRHFNNKPYSILSSNIL